MKSFSFTILFLAITCGACSAQNQVTDTHPTAAIYVVDPQSGQEVLAQDDAATLFKDAFIDLVSNTNRAKATIAPGHKNLVITQMDPSGGNAYQLTLDTKIFGQTVNMYTFSYNVDQNTLYYYDKVAQTWEPELIQGYNVTNLNNCLAFGKFNEQAPSGPPVPAAMGQTADNDQQAADESDQPVYTDNAPPVLRTDEQPECPVDGYLWQPGYWAYNPAGGYYWVNGSWVAPPQTGLLWTPPYWGFEGSRYMFHAGYWGSEVGYYGGIYYGYGYGGRGYYGGNWSGGHFRYNTAVVRVNVTVVHNTFVDRTVFQTSPHARVSFNGPGGVNVKPTTRELQAANEKRIPDHSQNPRGFNNNNAARTPGNNNAPAQRGSNNNFNRPNNNGTTNSTTTNNTNGSRPAVNTPNNNNTGTNTTVQRGPNNNFGRPDNASTTNNTTNSNNNRPAVNTPNNNNTGTNTTVQRGPNSNFNRPNAVPANSNAPKVPANNNVPRVPGGFNGQRAQGGNNLNKTPAQPQQGRGKPAPARQAPPKTDDKKQQ